MSSGWLGYNVKYSCKVFTNILIIKVFDSVRIGQMKTLHGFCIRIYSCYYLNDKTMNISSIQYLHFEKFSLDLVNQWRKNSFYCRIPEFKNAIALYRTYMYTQIISNHLGYWQNYDQILQFGVYRKHLWSQIRVWFCGPCFNSFSSFTRFLERLTLSIIVIINRISFLSSTLKFRELWFFVGPCKTDCFNILNFVQKLKYLKRFWTFGNLDFYSKI